MEIKKVSQLTGHKSPVYALEKIDDHSFLSASGDKMVAEWDLKNPDQGKLFSAATDIVYSLKYLPSHNLVLVGNASGGIHVIDTKTKKEIRLLQYHKSGVFSIEETGHGLLISLGGDGTLQSFSAENFAAEKTLFIGEFKLRGLAVNESKKEMALACGDGSIIIFSLPGLDIRKKWLAHRQGFSVNAICYSPDGNFLLSGSRDAHLNIFDCQNDYALTQSIPAHNYAIYKIAYNPGGRFFATASRDKTVKLWDAANFNFLSRLDAEKYHGHKHSVNTLLWMDGQTLLSGSDDRTIIAWDIHP